MPDRSNRKPSRAVPSPSPSSRLLILALVAIPTVLLVLLGISALGNLGIGTASPTPPSSAGPAPSGAGVLIREDSPTLGPADAPVTLVEFLDPECEACRAYYPVVKELLAEYGDDVRLVVRYVPGHGNSALAAIALEAARAQSEDGYWAMLELLFERQPEWGEQQAPQPQAFLDAADAVGLDVTRIQAAMTAGDTAMVERDLADAIAVGVEGTPTFFVNGVKVTEQSPDGLRAALDAALAAAG